VNTLDLIIIVLVVASAVHGMRLGAATQLLSYAGFFVGLVIGAALVLLIEPHVTGQLTKTIVALVCLLIPAAIVGGAGRQLGVRVWRALRRARFGTVDAGAGVIIAVAGTLVICWLFASILVNSTFLPVSTQIEHSRILREVEDVMPPVPDAFATVTRYLSTSGFPQVLVNILPESVNPVTVPTQREIQQTMALAGNSTVKVVAASCGNDEEGSGFVTGSDLVVTNAHVVAGSTSITVYARNGTRSRATPILFDPRLDVAVLATNPLGEKPLVVSGSYVERGTDAIVFGYPGGGPFTYGGAGILSRFEAQGRDIYDASVTDRAVYQLQAVVRPGNSGGPLVATDGKVIGVIFSRSASNDAIGYALASPPVLAEIERAEVDPRPTSTQSCVG
jgi:S1-C subfamily serine protease